MLRILTFQCALWTAQKKPLSVLNKEAVAFVKKGDDAHGVAAYAKVFRKIKEGNLTHPELYITHSNRAAAYLNLGLYEEVRFQSIPAPVPGRLVGRLVG